MRIAITTENGNIFQHFGKCKEFTIYEVSDGRVLNKMVLDASDSGHSALAILLHNSGVDTLICGGIGGGAREALKQNGIELIPGVTGSADEAISSYLSGKSIGDPDFVCNHHDHDHEHQHGHDCQCHN